jgi:hypothetical protein
MKQAFVFILLAVLIVMSCHNPEIASGVPSCIYKDINEISKDPQSFVGSVKEYQFKGKVVYAYEPDTRRVADGTTAIKDGECRTLCHVGGFAGPQNNQCNGGNFFTEAVFKRTIWEKK